MKYFSFLALLTSLVLQAGLMAQPYQNNQPAPQIEVQVQKLPSNHEEGSYFPKGTYTGQTQAGNKDENRLSNSGYANDAYAPPQSDELRPNQKIERTLSILKPDALKNRHVGDIISRFEDAGLRVAAIKMIRLSSEQASQFYSMHRERLFFPDLVKYMSSGPIIVIVLEGNQAISKNRQLMGSTDPKKAEKGTIRADFAQSITENAVHGSDSPEAARQEIAFFFQPNEIYTGY